MAGEPFCLFLLLLLLLLLLPRLLPLLLLVVLLGLDCVYLAIERRTDLQKAEAKSSDS